jgi:hypothetical protein
MSDADLKIVPRNLTARAAMDLPVVPVGNPMSSALQAGVGNCFPGLEFDLRNLERRFFPFLEVDLGGSFAIVASVDMAGVAAAQAAGTVTAASAAAYQTIANDLDSGWLVTRFQGDFGPLGQLDVTRDQIDAATESIGAGRIPVDVWSAVRLLREGKDVTLTFQANGEGPAVTLVGARARYLDPNGALAKIFEVGELTQSLCSPWSHDFRDCGCFYWASNHPDIAMPPRPAAADPTDPKWDLDTRWERADRSIDQPPVEDRRGDSGIAEVQHNEINRNWQMFNFVLERREQLLPYKEQPHIAQPLADMPALIAHLRFAAGVEIAVMQEYLAAWSSLRPPAGTADPLRGDLRAASSELLRIAIGEMRHIRGVNAVLRATMPAGSYTPALQVAAGIPEAPGVVRPVAFRPLTKPVIDEFIEIEAPSQSVDSLYGRILASLEAFGQPDQQQQAVRAIMAEGEEHWQTFLFIRQWLGKHEEADYLRNPTAGPAPPDNAAQLSLAQDYGDLLVMLRDAYEKGLPKGAAQLNQARNAMLGPSGIEGSIGAVAAAGFIPVFPVPADPRFAALPTPPE